jgi:hypothetical protein
VRGRGPGATVWRRCVKLASFHAKSQRRKGSSGQASIGWPGEWARRAADYLGRVQGRADLRRGLLTSGGLSTIMPALRSLYPVLDSGLSCHDVIVTWFALPFALDSFAELRTRADVSIKTVSRVVNDQGEISETTCQRVLACGLLSAKPCWSG